MRIRSFTGRRISASSARRARDIAPRSGSETVRMCFTAAMAATRILKRVIQRPVRLGSPLRAVSLATTVSYRSGACLSDRLLWNTACDWTVGTPSLFRVENCKGNCRFGNLWSQTADPTASVWLTRCAFFVTLRLSGITLLDYSTTFGGNGGSGGQTMATAGWDRPVVVATSDTLSCVRSGAALECEHK